MLIGTAGMTPEGRPPGPPRMLVGQALKEMELVSEGQIQEALQLQLGKGWRIGQALIKLEYIAPEELLLALAYQRGCELEDLDDIDDLRDHL